MPRVTPQRRGRIVVGVDGSDASRWLIRQAAELADRLGHRLDVVCAYEMPSAAFPDMQLWPSEIDAAARSALQQVINEAFATSTAGHPPPWVLPVAVPGRPVHMLMRHARSAELLVIGGGGRGSLANLVRGSVSAAVSAKAPCPVLVLPDGAELDLSGRQRIVVGVDGSPEARGALSWAVTLARTLGCGVDAVLAWEPEVTYPIGGPSVPGAEPLDPQARVEHEVMAVQDIAPDVRAVAEFGSAGAVLIRRARDAALLVLGSRRRAALASLVLGSTGATCLAAAPCPVVIAHPVGALPPWTAPSEPVGAAPAAASGGAT